MRLVISEDRIKMVGDGDEKYSRREVLAVVPRRGWDLPRQRKRMKGRKR